MADTRVIPIENLLIDEQNPRLAQPSNGQQAAIRDLASTLKTKLLRLAQDIQANGLNPSELPIVMPFGGGDAARYVVLDGNRRLAALRVMEQSDIVMSAVSRSVYREFIALARRYEGSPVREIECTVVDRRADATHWIQLRHTGEHGGAGHVRWGSDESDRFRSRNGDLAQFGTQVLDLLEHFGDITPEQRQSAYPTTLTRLLTSPVVRARVGLEQVRGTLLSMGPIAEVRKALKYVVQVVSEGQIGVRDVYTREQRTEFANQLPPDIVVERTAASGGGTPLPPFTALSQDGGARTRSLPPQRRRSNLIPDDCALSIIDHRTHEIERELRILNLDRTPNAIAVLFRVFLELSTEAYLETEGIIMQGRPSLADKLIKTVEHLERRQRVSRDQAVPVRVAASPNSFLQPSVTTMHQWVHNRFLTPTGTDLRTYWDNLQPFISALWTP